jgi:isopropylmalate/homocitrate/citramalate synthase
VGVAKTHLVLGKHSGRAALRHRLEQLGFTLTRDELQQTTTALSPSPTARRTSTTRI